MNEYWGQYWGEMPPNPTLPDVGSGIIAVERAEMTRVGPLCVQSVKMDYSLSERSEETVREEGDVAEVPVGNPVMLHTIRLLQLRRQLNANCPPNDSVCPLIEPSIPPLIQTNDKESNEWQVSQIRGKCLNEKAVKELMRRAVVIIAVFYGYDYTNQSVIDLLVDISIEYLIRLCRTIRTTTDSLELKSCNDFIDVIDRVFHDMNGTNLESLRQYDSDLRLYNQNLYKQVVRKVETNESINTANKITSNHFQLPLDSNCDHSPKLSATTEPETKEPEPTLSLKSLLSSFKSDETQENEQLFGLTSPSNSNSNKTIEN